MATKERTRTPNAQADEADLVQRRTNHRLWVTRDHVDAYDRRNLRPAEVLILVRYREELSGRVLELGCGAGRVMGYLTQMAEYAHGIDVSPAMIERCRESYPEGSFSTGDVRDLTGFADSSFDVVFASFNIFDLFSHDERHAMLAATRRLLSPNGLLILSSHNRGYQARIPRPTRVRTSNVTKAAADLVRLPRRVRNARRLSRYEQETEEYAVLNDDLDNHSALHYYIGRDAQERQLHEHDFALLECLTLDGHAVLPGEVAEASPDLHYVARVQTPLHLLR
jgi:SAM-dependent methyltransferase